MPATLILVASYHICLYIHIITYIYVIYVSIVYIHMIHVHIDILLHGDWHLETSRDEPRNRCDKSSISSFRWPVRNAMQRCPSVRCDGDKRIAVLVVLSKLKREIGWYQYLVSMLCNIICIWWHVCIFNVYCCCLKCCMHVMYACLFHYDMHAFFCIKLNQRKGRHDAYIQDLMHTQAYRTVDAWDCVISHCHF